MKEKSLRKLQDEANLILNETAQEIVDYAEKNAIADRLDVVIVKSMLLRMISRYNDVLMKSFISGYKEGGDKRE